MKKNLLSALLLLTACAPTNAPSPSPAPQVISVYATAAAQPWLADVYACANQFSVVIRLSISQSVDESAADIVIRIGEPENLSSPAYQIGSEDLLIVTHRESTIQNLTIEQVRALFSQGQADVQLWVFASGEDVQQVFGREVMQGAGISSLARLAADPQQMSDALNAEKNAVGILPRHWKAGTMRYVFMLPSVPVLAITPSELPEAAREIVVCLQQKAAP